MLLRVMKLLYKKAQFFLPDIPRPPCLKNNVQTISRKLKKLPKYRTFVYMGKEKL
jgi:hypothetical protein